MFSRGFERDRRFIGVI
jgi:hypothetical protein